MLNKPVKVIHAIIEVYVHQFLRKNLQRIALLCAYVHPNTLECLAKKISANVLVRTMELVIIHRIMVTDVRVHRCSTVHFVNMIIETTHFVVYHHAKTTARVY